MRKNFLRWLGLTALVLLAASCKPSPPQNSVSGTIETDEVRVASRYGGRVAQIIAQEGDTLKTNQVIAELAAPELRARRDQMAAELAEWEAGPRKEELEAARHDWEAVAAELQQAQADAQRAELLLKTKTISPTEQEQAATKARTLAKNEAAAKSRYELLKAGTRPERLAQARAQLAEIDAQLNEMKIVAPSDCVLEVLDVKVGDVLPAGREVATLLLPQHLWVRVYVPETWLGHIQVGQKVNVHVDSESKKGFQGTVEQVAREAEFTPRNVQTVGERIKQVFGIKVRLEAQDGQLRPGMAADVGFPEIKP